LSGFPHIKILAADVHRTGKSRQQAGQPFVSENRTRYRIVFETGNIPTGSPGCFFPNEARRISLPFLCHARR
jgi:hypothetical protein